MKINDTILTDGQEHVIRQALDAWEAMLPPDNVGDPFTQSMTRAYRKRIREVKRILDK